MAKPRKELNAQQQESRAFGKKVLLGFVLFFMTFASVDAYFIYRALKTHRGVVTEHAYEKGLAFNKVLEQARAEGDSSPIDKVHVDAGHLRIHVLEGAAPKHMVAYVRNPVQGGADKTLELQTLAPHIFTTKETLQKGKWQLILELTWDNNTSYHHSEMISLY